MTRRTDYATAEKVSLALLAQAAFGKQAAMRNALLAGLSPALVERILGRPQWNVRKEVEGVDVIKDRRHQQRESM